MKTVLMYHAIPAEGAAPDAQADAHYSVALPAFARHLALMAARGLRPSSVADLLQPGAAPGVGITFDDGHATNLQAAALLRDAKGSGDFFVNPSTVGTPGYLTWDALREMAAWGMSIQSHGMHHRFLDDLSPDEVTAELKDSKQAIEDHLGRPVTLYAPAGGRMAPGIAALARRLGYARICSSRVGLWDERRPEPMDIPRLAVLAATADAQVQRWVQQSFFEMAWQRSRYAVLRSAKRALGNGAYVRLRQALVRTPV